MATLYQKLEEDMKSSLRAGDSIKLSVLRMAISEIKMIEIKKNIKTASDDDVLQVLQRHIKQHKDSIEQFTKGARKDLADKELKELKILETYMPEQLGENEIVAIVKDTISETGASLKSESGKVIKAVFEKVKGRADGKLVSQTVMSLLK